MIYQSIHCGYFLTKTMVIIKKTFWPLCGKIVPLVLNSTVSFVPGSVCCSSALCLFINLSIYKGQFTYKLKSYIYCLTSVLSDAWAHITNNPDTPFSGLHSLPSSFLNKAPHTGYQESDSLQDIRKSLNEAREELM